MNKKLLLIIPFLLIIITPFYYEYNLESPVDPSSTKEVYEVVSLATPNEVFDDLHKQGFIKSAKKGKNLFSKNNYQLTANVYSISKSDTLTEIVDILGNPTSNVDASQACKLVITEGMQYTQILSSLESCQMYSYEELDEYLSQKENLDRYISEYWFLDENIYDEKVTHPLEGYFAPATYYFLNDSSIDEIAMKLLDTTKANLEEYKNDPLLKKYSIKEIISLASLVEREAMHEQDRYKIAGVFLNRLEMDMMLQSDISVLYALDSTQEFVSYDDLEVDSYYNTYMYKGLMPGPISSPSKSSIDAVFNSEDNDYIYFFADQNTGEVYYSKTLEEHEEISQKYKWE